MQDKIKKVNIEGRNYVICAFGASEGLQIFGEFTKIVGRASGSISTIISAIDSGGKLLDIDTKEIVTALVSIFDADISAFLKKLLSSTQVDEKLITDVIFDDVFARDYVSLILVAKEVLDFNFFSLISTRLKTSKIIKK